MLSFLHSFPPSVILAWMLAVLAILVGVFPRWIVGRASCFFPDLQGYNAAIRTRLEMAMDRYDCESNGREACVYALSATLLILAALCFMRRIDPRFAMVLAALAAAGFQALVIVLMRREPGRRVALLRERTALEGFQLRDIVATIVVLAVGTVGAAFAGSWWPLIAICALFAFALVGFAFVYASRSSAIGSSDPIAERIVDERVRRGRSTMLLNLGVSVIVVPLLLLERSSFSMPVRLLAFVVLLSSVLLVNRFAPRMGNIELDELTQGPSNS